MVIGNYRKDAVEIYNSFLLNRISLLTSICLIWGEWM